MMKPERQRIVIAEACGWQFEPGEEPRYGGEYVQTGWYDPSGKFHRGVFYAKDIGVPDYLNDLNAMHEVEKILSEEQANAMACLLHEMVNGDEGVGVECWGFHASAAQRAEAFLRTLGKWEED